MGVSQRTQFFGIKRKVYLGKKKPFYLVKAEKKKSLHLKPRGRLSYQNLKNSGLKGVNIDTPGETGYLLNF